LTIISTSCVSVPDNSSLTERTMPVRYGSPNKCASGSWMTRATESVRRVTRVRAARFGT
jgi:hypothetical protein